MTFVIDNDGMDGRSIPCGMISWNWRGFYETTRFWISGFSGLHRGGDWAVFVDDWEVPATLK